MKYLPFKIIIICILFPPLLHLGTVHYLEKYLKTTYLRDIENIYTGDTQTLFDGAIRLKDAVNNNIDNYLQSRPLVPLGVMPDVMVTTKTGAVIYPSFEDETTLLQPVPKQIAEENYRLMNEGLEIKVDLSFKLSSVFTLAIFIFYLSVSLAMLYYFYRQGGIKAMRESRYRENEIARLRDRESENKERVSVLSRDKTALSEEFTRIKGALKKNLQENRKNEDGMIEEIIALEEKIDEIHTLYDGQNEDNEALRDMIARYEAGVLKSEKNREKDSKLVSKRFKILYKEITFHSRAIYGFSDLPEEMKLKAEEMLQNFKISPDAVKVKRKLSTKKKVGAVFEIAFSRTGRIYYSQDEGEKIKVLVIGTKNTQDRDIAFINTL